MRLLHIAAVGVFLCTTAAADQITIKNGDRLTGKIVSADEKVVLLKTDYAGELKLDRAAVTGIQADEALNITVKGVGTVKGMISESTASANISKADGTSLTAAPEDVTAIRDDAAQHAYDRELERTSRPRLNDFWAGFVSLGFANASGNSKTTTISTTGSGTRVAGKNKIVLTFAQLYATQSTTEPSGETANKVSGAVRIDHDLRLRVFVYGANAYDYDRFQNLDLRVVLGGGFGFHAWKSDRGYLDVAGGGDWNREAFGTSGDVPAFVRNSAELTVGEEGAYAMYSRLKLFERFAFFPNMTSTGDYRFLFDATASVPIFKSLDWNLGFNDRYLSNPPNSIGKNDTILTMGVRFSFDQTKH